MSYKYKLRTKKLKKAPRYSETIAPPEFCDPLLFPDWQEILVPPVPHVPAPRVLNHHRDGYPDGAVDIMRPSIWGNPFPLRNESKRQAVLRLYTLWIGQPEQAGLRAKAKMKLRGKDLVCCCAPKACHGDILLSIANE